MMRKLPAMVGGMAVTAALVGCAGLDAPFQAGVSGQSEVRQARGAPVVVLEGTDGASIWQYPEGPMGLRTFVARFDSRGTLQSYEQVLDEAHFARIQIGKATTDDVRAMLGPPWRTMDFRRTREFAWDYNFRDFAGYIAEFSVTFNTSGVVVGKFQKRLNDSFDSLP